RVLRLGDASGVSRRDVDARGGRRPARRVRSGHCVLRGRSRPRPDAARILLSDRGRHRRGSSKARNAPRRRGDPVPLTKPVSRVAVLAGGRSPEREVSLRSGHRVVTALGSRGHDASLLDPAEAPLVETLAAGALDVCAIALHGKDGEDGTVQRLLETLDIPYTGTGPF